MAKGPEKTIRIDDEPSEFSGKPPTNTEPQELPFQDLAWEDFEKLCYRLIKKDAKIEEIKYYRTKGHRQYGIDIITWMKDKKKVVYQCKRHKNYTASKLVEAIEKFKTGKLCQEGITFIFCISLPLSNLVDTIDEWKKKLRKENNVNFQVWDSNDLSRKLKKHRNIVSSFFGEAWVKIFSKNPESGRNTKSENKEQQPDTNPDPIIAEYRFNNFKTQYKNYFSSMLETLKDTHKEVFIKGRTCEPVQWEKEASRFIKDDKGLQTYNMKKILTDTSIETPIAIIGSMGAGKSVYVYQLMEMHRSGLKDTLIFFGEFVQWKKEIEKSGLIKAFSNFIFQTLTHFISNSEINETDNEFRNMLEEYIEKKNAIILIDGIDEFTEGETDIKKLIETLQYNHRVIITGRDYSVREFQASFSNEKNDRLKILRLNDFTNIQVSEFVNKISRNEEIETNFKISKLKKLAPMGKIYPELNYRNPLILKAILRNPPKGREKLSEYLILEKIAKGTFEWFIGKKYREPNFRFTWNDLDNLNPNEIKICFFGKCSPPSQKE